ncbi:MAG: MBL fold metallo-hydrolase, partial [Acidiferrobacterales bacterium]|nr:MBL fold metallo-hydrolase [Acidiferrobacterales bacterium]
EAFPFEPSSIDVVILSHAHLDHSGRLPKLVNDGFKGPIYMTLPTCDLLEIMLKDSAFLSMRDAEWENKRRRRAGKEEVEPLYTIDDVERTLKLCEGLSYAEPQVIADGLQVRFLDAGHILGSAIVEMTITEDGKPRRLVFSGDLGNSCAALLRDPVKVEKADVLIMESTYGDRDHRSMDATLDEFRSIILAATESGGNVLIPAFAVGRTQEIIFRLGEFYQEGILNHQAVYLDSPMAIATTEVYHRYQNVFNVEDKTALRQARSASLHTFLPVLRYSRTTEESIAINKITDGAIIIAGSGMCNGGRIRHHLKHNLWRRNAHVIIVGYQAIGTPGRALVDGAKRLRVAGEDVVVNATIHTLGGFSAHAGQQQLLDWIGAFHHPKPHTYLVHGEPEAKKALQNHLQAMDIKAEIPNLGKSIHI